MGTKAENGVIAFRYRSRIEDRNLMQSIDSR